MHTCYTKPHNHDNFEVALKTPMQLCVCVACLQHESQAYAVLNPHKAQVPAAQDLQPTMPTSHQLLTWQQWLKGKALKAARLEVCDPSYDGGPLTYNSIQMVRAASMACTMFGHTSLAQRNSLAITAKCSKFSGTPCSRPNCPAKGRCKGNTFMASDANEAHQPDVLVVCHHKTSHKGIRGITLQIKVSVRAGACTLHCLFLYEPWHGHANITMCISYHECRHSHTKHHDACMEG